MNVKQSFNEGKYYLDELPQEVYIESYMGCNLSCEMCPVPKRNKTMNGRKSVAMSIQTFTNIIKSISDKPRYVHLNQMGEPLLNKNVSEFVKIAKLNNHNVGLTTNGLLMNKNTAEKIIKAGIG